MARCRRIPLVLLALALCAPGLSGQEAPILDPNRIQMSRDELTELLQQFETTGRSDAYSTLVRGEIDAQLQLVRRRLEEGDFQVGDQVVLTVRGETELTSTFTVQPNQVLRLPSIGDVPLRGVLRSELEDHLTGVLKQYLRDPEVQAQALFRIMISGAVARPGYYVVPAQALVSEAVMQAGGFTPGADIQAVRVLRGPAVIWDADELQRAIAEGRTFDQLSIRAGDHVEVPALPTESRWIAIRNYLVIVPTLISLFTLFR